MLAIERRNEILVKLQEENKVLVNDLSQYYQVTEETIRRDLEKLEQEGFAKKTYGGAIFCDNLGVELPYNVRKQANIKEKQIIADMIGKLVQDGDRIMLDASSTTLYVSRMLKKKKNLTIITNSIEILLELADKTDFKVMSTGGTLKEGALALVGQQAERMVDNFYADIAIVSCKGIEMEHGITDSNEPDVQMKSHFIRASKKRILAVDSAKFDKISFVKMNDLTDFDILVTDKEPDEKWKEMLEQTQIEVYYGNS